MKGKIWDHQWFFKNNHKVIQEKKEKGDESE